MRVCARPPRTRAARPRRHDGPPVPRGQYYPKRANRRGVCPGPAGASAGRARSVLVLDVEVRAPDRSGELRLLPRELEARRELLGDLHPVGELEADRAL